MLQINPKKFKKIQNNTIPNPLRPRFRNKNQTSIYFLSKKKFEGKKKELIINSAKIVISIIFITAGAFLLSS